MPRKKKDDEIVEGAENADIETNETENTADASNEETTDFAAESEIDPAPEPSSDEAPDEQAPDSDDAEYDAEPEAEPDISYSFSAEQPAEDSAAPELFAEPEELAEPEPETSPSADGDAPQLTETAEESETLPAPALEPAPRPERVVRKPAPPRKKNIMNLNLNALDRDLSDKQRDEWNAIYASFRSKSVMSGTVVGIDQNTFDVRNRETGIQEKKTMYTLVVIGYRVKIIIPEAELWMPGEERPSFTIRGMAGAKIDFVVMEIDREGECAIASRRLAITERRRHFIRGDHNVGEQLMCRALIVGAKRCSVECNGFDLHLTQRDLSYTTIADLREKYSTGQELKCVLTSIDRKKGTIKISVKDAMPNPFDGADVRHPIRSRRQAVISGKYAGGVFCTLPDDTVCLCLYSTQHADGDFRVGDGVILAVSKHDFSRQLMYGKILSKW